MKKFRATLLLFALLALGLSSCNNCSKSSLSDADKAAITKTTADLNQAFNNTKDYKAYVTSYYAEDATVLYPNNEILKGHDALLAMFPSFGTDINIYPTILEINGKDDIAYVVGTVKMENNAKVELDRGKYIEIWKKQKDGNWKVIYDIFNSSVPIAAETTKTE